MSALLTSRPRARDERRASGQGLLFGDGPVVSERPVVDAPRVPAATAITETPPAVGPDAIAAPAGITLDAAIASLWSELTAGEAAACPVCEAPMEPVHSPGTGVAGGRCGSCGSTLS